MLKVLKLTVIVICCLMLVLMFMPTGSSVDDVVAGYQSTLSYANSESMVYQYMETIKPGDPLLDKVQENVGDHVDYTWVTEDGTKVYPALSDTFPTRGGSGRRENWKDYMSGPSWHSGVDLVPSRSAGSISKESTPLYSVAIWGGTVVSVPPYNKWRGHQVIIDCGNGFYVRYQHLAYGGDHAPKWQRGHGSDESSIIVKVGDKVMPGEKIGFLGASGKGLTGSHLHLELMLWPNGFNVAQDDLEGANKGAYWVANGAAVLLAGKKLNELTWYDMVPHKAYIKKGSYNDVFGD